MVPQAHNPAMLLCDLWAVWFQVVFGVFLWWSCLVFRYLRLILVVKFHKDLSGWKSWALLFALWLPIAIYGAFASGFKVDVPTPDSNGVELCFFVSKGFYPFMVLLFLYLIVAVYASVTLRNVKQRDLRDYNEATVTLVFFVLSYIVYCTLLLLNQQYMEWGRIVNSVIVSLFFSTPPALLPTSHLDFFLCV